MTRPGITIGYGPIMTSWQYRDAIEELARLSISGGSKVLIDALELRIREYERMVKRFKEEYGK